MSTKTSQVGGGFDRGQIELLLGEVASIAARRNVSVSMFLVGGAAIALAYSTDRATTDLDGVFEPKAVVYEIAEEVAANHPEFRLQPDWINDAVKGFLIGDDPDSTVRFERPGLAVSVASPRYLFKMKAMAARESDVDDLRLLFRLAGYQNAAEALADVEMAYRGQPVKMSSQYLIEEIASESQTASALSPRPDEANSCPDHR